MPECDAALIQQYSPLVHKIALHLQAKLPASIMLDDLLAAGMLGLLEAHNNFDDSKAVSFSTFASFRIRGAMLDEIRKSNWTPRSVAKKMRQISAAISQVEAQTSKPATAAQIAAQLNLSVNDYYSLLDEVKGCQVCSLDELISDNQLQECETEQNTHTKIALSHEKQHFAQQLAQHIHKLPKREQIVISLYYLDELNFKQIGQVLEVSESRISQLHSQAIARLRASLTI